MRAEAGMDGGFHKGEPSDGALVIFYAADLEDRVERCDFVGR